MKETLLNIIKGSLDFDSELRGYEVGYPDDGDPFVWLDYFSTKVGRLRVGVTIETEQISLFIIPERFNNEESDIWDNQIMYSILNRANIHLGYDYKMIAPDHLLGNKTFSVRHTSISFGEVLMNKHVIPGAIRKLIWYTEYGIGKMENALRGKY